MKLLGVGTTTWYTLLVILVALERLLELAISSRNVRRLLRRGAVEAGARDYRWMVILHAVFLPACALEAVLLHRPWLPALAASMTALLAGTMALRYWVIWTLRERWTTRVICLPGEPLVRSGPYVWLRHPNYLAVLLELPALALIHGSWLTAAVFGVLNALVLRRRVQVEEQALRRFPRDVAAGDPAEEQPGAAPRGIVTPNRAVEGS